MRMPVRMGLSLTILDVQVQIEKSACFGIVGPRSVDTEPMLGDFFGEFVERGVSVLNKKRTILLWSHGKGKLSICNGRSNLSFSLGLYVRWHYWSKVACWGE
jgi:hypothetical protein